MNKQMTERMSEKMNTWTERLNECITEWLNDKWTKNDWINDLRKDWM